MAKHPPTKQVSKRSSATGPRARRSGQHPTAAEKKQAKHDFLASFATNANVLRASEAAGVNRVTVYRWLDDDEDFAGQYRLAEEDATSLLYEEARRRAYEGVIKPVVSAGRLVYEEIPDLDQFGDPVLDKHGKPTYKRGNPLFIREYSDTLMKMLLVAHDPKKFSERQRLEVTGKDGGPIQQQTTITFTELQSLANSIPTKLEEWRKQRALPLQTEKDTLTG